MSPLQAVVLGALQGITEFIPVSSSGHLVLVPMALGWDKAGLVFNTIVHLGTLVALLIYFRAELVTIISMALRRQGKGQIAQRRLLLYLAVASLPAGIAGLLLKSTFEPLFQSGQSVGFALLVTSAVLVVGELQARRLSLSAPRELPGFRGALAIGVAQAFAIVPGLSRSGSTIAAGLAVGLDRSSAARFSFLMAIPIVAGAGLFSLTDAIRAGIHPDEVVALALGGVSAAVAGYFSIGWLISWLQNRRLIVFGVYCAVAGIVAIVLS